jgi:hypothetical protein
MSGHRTELGHAASIKKDGRRPAQGAQRSPPRQPGVRVANQHGRGDALRHSDGPGTTERGHRRRGGRDIENGPCGPSVPQSLAELGRVAGDNGQRLGRREVNNHRAWIKLRTTRCIHVPAPGGRSRENVLGSPPASTCSCRSGIRSRSVDPHSAARACSEPARRWVVSTAVIPRAGPSRSRRSNRSARVDAHSSGQRPRSMSMSSRRTSPGVGVGPSASSSTSHTAATSAGYFRASALATASAASTPDFPDPWAPTTSRLPW